MTSTLNLTGYKLTFDDEFNTFSVWNGTSGTWEPSWPGSTEGNAGPSNNNEAEFYVNPNYGPTDSFDPFSIDNGELTITAEPTPSALLPYVDNMPYVSGMITTHESFSQVYGYFEMRAELPAGQGLWPAFWMVPAGPPQWPPEIDVVEELGQTPNVLYQTVHYTGSNGEATAVGFAPNVANMSEGYHTYGVLWTASTITFYFDGQETAQVATPSDLVGQPMEMVANLAVGGTGSWPGPPDSSTQFPAEMKIDYIRAYSDDPNATAVALQPISSPDGANTYPYGAVIANAATDPPPTLSGSITAGTDNGGSWVSADGSALTPDSTASLTTMDGTWTFGTGTNASGTFIMLNGAQAGGNGAGSLLVVSGGDLYAYNLQGQWWEWLNDTWNQASEPLAVSADGTSVQAGSGMALDTSAGVWSFSTATGVGGNMVLLDGASAAGGSAALLEVDSGGNLFAESTQGSWYEWVNGAWAAASDPNPASASGSSGTTSTGSGGSSGGTSTGSGSSSGGTSSGSNPPSSSGSVSPTGAALTPDSQGSLVTSDGTWTFSTATESPGNEILLNGTQAGNGAGSLLVVSGGDLYAYNLQGQWWEWLNGTWTLASEPLAVSADGTAVQAGSGMALDNSAGVWSFSTATGVGGNIILLDGASAAGGSATLLEVDSGGNLFAENAQGNWYEWVNGAWAAASDPNPASASGSSGASSTGSGSSSGSTSTGSGSSSGGTSTGAGSSSGGTSTGSGSSSGGTSTAGSDSPTGAALTPDSHGSLVTSDGTWTFSTATASPGNVILLDGTQAGNGSGVLLVVAGGHVYADSAQGTWWEWVNGTWTAASEPLPVSTDGASLTPASGTALVTTDGVWTFSTAADGNGNIILLNGVEAGGYGSASLLEVDAGGHLFAENTSGAWYEYVAGAWALTTTPDPAPVAGSDPPPASVNDAVVTPASGGDIVSTAGNVFAIDAAGQVTENGNILGATSGTTELAFVDNIVFQEAAGVWSAFNEATGQWTATVNPIEAQPSASGTLLTGTSGDIATAAGNVFALNASGQVVENGTALAQTSTIAELAYIDGKLYEETSSDAWSVLNQKTGAWSSVTDPLSSSHAMAPVLTVYEAQGTENTAIPLYIQATQADSDLAASNLTVTISNLGGATLNQGVDSHGTWTLTAAQLSGLTVTPAANFTGDLSIKVSASDTQNGSSASSGTDILHLMVSGTSEPSETFVWPSDVQGSDHIYTISSMPTTNVHITSFNPATDILDLAPLLNSVAEPGITPVVTLEATSNGGTAVAVDPTGDAANHGTVVVTLDHVLPQNVPAIDVWH